MEVEEDDFLSAGVFAKKELGVVLVVNKQQQQQRGGDDDGDPRRRRSYVSENRMDVDHGSREAIRAENHNLRVVQQAEGIIMMDEDKGVNYNNHHEEEEVLEERRRRQREKSLKKHLEREALLLAEEEKEDEEDEYDDDDSEESEEEEEAAVTTTTTLRKPPVYTIKSKRDTIAEREQLEAKKRAQEETVKRNKEEMKLETKKLVAEQVCKDEEVTRKHNLDYADANNIIMSAAAQDIHTDDDEAGLYEAGTVRELARVKRDKELREGGGGKLKEKVKKKEREEEIDQNPRPKKKKYHYLQKYYHKGAFFQNDLADLLNHYDFSAPTGEDKMDKSALPEILQVRRFGRSGRTKHTHLAKEDTTDRTYNALCMYRPAMLPGKKTVEKPRGSKRFKDWGSDQSY